MTMDYYPEQKVGAMLRTKVSLIFSTEHECLCRELYTEFAPVIIAYNKCNLIKKGEVSEKMRHVRDSYLDDEAMLTIFYFNRKL